MIRSLLKRLLCVFGIHSWGIYSWFPTMSLAVLMCADCHKQAWLYEGEK